MTEAVPSRKQNHERSSKLQAGHTYDETAFARSRRALSNKTAVQLLCLQAMRWASTQTHLNLLDGSGKKAIDIGCAYGYVVSLLNQLNYDALGLDISSYVLDAEEKGNSLQGDAQSLPVKSNSIDLITCFDTLEHLERPDLFVKESYRCLRPEGVFIAENPIANTIDLISDKLHKMDEIHPSLLTHNEIIFLVEKAGFHTSKKGLLPVPFQRFPLLGRFLEIGVPASIARRVVIVAVKPKPKEVIEGRPTTKNIAT